MKKGEQIVNISQIELTEAINSIEKFVISAKQNTDGLTADEALTFLFTKAAAAIKLPGTLWINKRNKREYVVLNTSVINSNNGTKAIDTIMILYVAANDWTQFYVRKYDEFVIKFIAKNPSDDLPSNT